MKKALFVVLLAVLGLLIYATCTDKPPVRQASFQRTKAEGMPITRKNWALFFPQKNWEISKSSNPQIELVAQNPRLAMMFMVITEPTADTFEDYAVANVKTMTNDLGGKLRSVDLVSINQQAWLSIFLNNPDVWVWIGVKNGIGYDLTCGGDVELDAGDSLQDRCQEIANTFQIRG